MPGVVTRPPAVRPDADYRGTPTITSFDNSFSITERFVYSFVRFLLVFLPFDLEVAQCLRFACWSSGIYLSFLACLLL